jgi:ketosteroid isomerase-like protein
MKNGLPGFLGSLSVTSLLVFPQTLSAGVAVDPVAAAAAVRKADTDWAVAAGAASIGDWMSFYAADAILLLPDDQPASGKELIRPLVSRLLALPHLSISWRPLEANVARSGDLAYLVAAYELRFDDSGGAPVSDRGRRLEVWKKQADESWKCIVDSWNVDPPSAAEAVPPPVPPTAAAMLPPPESARGTSPAAGPAVSLAQGEPPPPASVQEAGPPAPAHGAATKYGDMPANYEAAIRQYYLTLLKHPESVQYREITHPEEGFTTEITGRLLMREKREYGWTVRATINAKDSHDSYVGFKTYTFLFRGEKIVDARLPLPGDEIN